MDTGQWRRRIGQFADELSDLAPASSGATPEAVTHAVASLRRLVELLDAGPQDAHPGPAAPVEVVAPVLGVDGCRAGWVGAVLEPGAPRPRLTSSAASLEPAR